MCKVMKYSLYKADAEEENEDSPKLDEKPGGVAPMDTRRRNKRNATTDIRRTKTVISTGEDRRALSVKCGCLNQMSGGCEEGV